MEGKLKILFVSEDTLTGKIIQKATGGEWSHVAVFALNGLVEAMPPIVTVSSEHRYDKYPTDIIEVTVPDIEAALAELKSLIGKPYSLLSCIDGGLHDLFDIQLSGDGDKAVNCCELAVRTLIAGGFKFNEDINPDCWTPQRVYAELKIMNV